MQHITMDPVTIKFLFSVVFVLIGSLTFHISSLVSGENIYRDLKTLEATLLSTVAGIVIFLLSPISLIIFSPINFIHLSPTGYIDILVKILDFWVLFPFFGGAFGLGLIFGCVAILKARVNVLMWLRSISGMRFLISSYGLTWDDFLKGVKRKGEVFVQTDNGMFTGLLNIYSIREEPREIVLENSKIKRYGIERDIEGKENVNLLIPESEIKRIIVPERSFKKHYESMDHVSQAFYCISLAIGLFFLACSAYVTENYMPNLELESESLASLMFFYHTLSLIFLVLCIVVLIVSLLVAKKDFVNCWSFCWLSPNIIFVALFFLLLLILFILFKTLIPQIFLIHPFILPFIINLLPFICFYFLYFRKWLRKPIIDCFDSIKENFGDNKLLEEVIESFYLQLSCNEKDKIEYREKEILKKYEKDTEKQKKIKEMINKLKALRDDGTCAEKSNSKRKYLKDEDFNIILAFKTIIEKD